LKIVDEWRQNRHSSAHQDEVCSIMLKYKGDDMEEIVEPYERWISDGRPMDKELKAKWFARFSTEKEKEGLEKFL
jgi:hypothetical protein